LSVREDRIRIFEEVMGLPRVRVIRIFVFVPLYQVASAAGCESQHVLQDIHSLCWPIRVVSFFVARQTGKAAAKSAAAAFTAHPMAGGQEMSSQRRGSGRQD
jgi:hypothetical protein